MKSMITASDTVEQRISQLIVQMTVEEKAGQLNQVGVDQTGYDRTLELIRKGQVGSLIRPASEFGGKERPYLADAERTNAFQRVAVEESRLGVPILFGRDVIHGYYTTFPIPLAQAASWDLALVEQAAAIAAREASQDGVQWTFAPMLDIARDPRWGRVIEGCGEDPYLTSRMAEALVTGYQGDPPGQPGRIAACAKHYVGYGVSEGGRDYNSTDIPDYTLRNVYLPPFKAAVEAGVDTVMSSFNDISGVPVTASHHLLSDVLKDEYGFDGFVISDWEAIFQLINQRVAQNRKDAAAKAFKAGVDMDMIDPCYLENLPCLVQEGVISMDQLDDAVRRILRVKFEIGLFDHPYTIAAEAPQPDQEALHCARALARRGMVLLKNEAGILPLKKTDQRIAVIGPLAEAREPHLGAWACAGDPEEVVGLVEGMRAVAPEAEILTASPLADDMLMAARKADVVVLALGESRMRSGEAHSVADLALSPDQEALLEAVSRLNPQIISVVCAGRPLSLLPVERDSKAILYAWHSGIQAGMAVADLLFGDENPSGKLPITFPRSTGQIPIFYNHRNTGRYIDEYYGKSIFNNYQDLPGSPLYPFGYGLSYTHFTYGPVQIDRERIKPGEAVSVTVKVSNVGERAGEEVVQCYISDYYASLIRPVKELKGFRRVSLAPGESQMVHFTLGAAEMSYYYPDGELVLEPGEFKVCVGGSSLVEDGAVFVVE